MQLLIWDRTFYNPETGEYTVDRFLADTESRIGPIDAVLIWHVYPNLGVDDRNQFDLLRDLPGGIPALREMVQKFHSRGVKVFFPIIAWDTGTREEGTPPWVAVSQLLKDIGADGVNFDTLESIPVQFRSASDATGHPLALEPQFDIRDESIAWAQPRVERLGHVGRQGISIRADGEQEQMARAAAHGQCHRPLYARQDGQPAARFLQRAGLCHAR